MRAGRLRDLVTIEEPIEQQDEFGEEVKKWTPLPGGSVWAEKADLTGVELFRAQQISAHVTTRFAIRNMSSIDARMRVVHDDDCYSIEYFVDPDNRRRRLHLFCSRDINE